MSDEPFLSRWSRLKRRPEAGPERSPDKDARGQALADALPSSPAEPAPPPNPVPQQPLPPVESLTPESDFTPFMKAEVDPGTRRQALKTLFQDPRYNVMDGLDVYIDDYSKPDPLPEGWLERLNQVARLGEYRDPEEKAPKPEGEGAPEAPRAAAAGDEIIEQKEVLEAAQEDPQATSPPTPDPARENTVPPPGT